MDSTNRVLPLFPLPLVQFPGALTPLHIFEPRYRKMLRDVLLSDKTFGIIYQKQPQTASSPETEVGCSVEVVDSSLLPDGRSNILCRGIRRFRIDHYLEGEPYLRAQVAFFDDEASTGDLSEQVTRVSELLVRVVELSQRLGEALPGVDTSSIELPDEAELLSSIVCSCINVEAEQKQDLLELLDTARRLEIAGGWLETMVTDYEKRIFAKEVAGKNGHHGPVSREQ
jgi:ATP-dependent Lon protease